MARRLSCHAVLIATGASFHTLKMPGATALTGAGIYYGAAYTEAMNYKDKDVFVVGGANSAAQGAIYLSQFARKVTVLIRGAEPTASKYLVDAMNENNKIEILLNTDLVEVKGSNTLEQIVIKNTKSGESQTLDASALFVFIGVQPQSQIVSDLVMCSGKGYIFTGSDLMVDKKPPLRLDPGTGPVSVGDQHPGHFRGRRCALWNQSSRRVRGWRRRDRICVDQGIFEDVVKYHVILRERSSRPKQLRRTSAHAGEIASLTGAELSLHNDIK